MHCGIPKKNNLSHRGAAGQIRLALADLLLVSHLSQSLLPLVCRHFVAFPLFATRHMLLLS